MYGTIANDLERGWKSLLPY